jgi:hypothetical protein
MSVNDVTGDRLVSDVPSDKFKSGWNAIWGKLDKVIEAIAEDSGEETVTDEDVLRDIEQPLGVTIEEDEAWKEMERK